MSGWTFMRVVVLTPFVCTYAKPSWNVRDNSAAFLVGAA